MNLPNGWGNAKMADLASKIGSGATPRGGRDAYFSEGIPLIRSMNVHFDGFRSNGLAFIDSQQANELANVEVLADDVLLNITGASIGRVCLAPEEVSGARVNQHVCIIRPDVALPAYLRAFLAAPEMQRFILEENYGLTRQALTKGMIEEIDVPLPPPAEQRRIVAKLDALTARIARVRAELDRVPLLTRVLRESTLSQAFESGLSYCKKSAVLSDLCTSITDGDHQAPPRSVEGVPFITISAMNDGRIDLNKATRFVPIEYYESLKDTRRAQRDDILYSVTGSIGIPALVLENVPFAFQRHIAILRTDKKKCNAHWLMRILAAPQVKAQASEVATGTAQLTVPLTGLRRFSVPEIPLEIQEKQLAWINRTFARADRLEAEAARARKLLDRLESAILAKAFRGELVPQDENDEPAEKLLERIRAERKAAPKPKRGRRAAS